MGFCESCKWWGVDFEGVCDFVNTNLAEAEETRFQVEADAADDQGLSCALITGPGFGCIHYKGRA